MDRLPAGWTFDLVCGFYFLVLSDRVVGAADAAAREDLAAPWLAVLLAGALLLETWALPHRLRSVATARGGSQVYGLGAYLALGHVVLSVLLAFVLAAALGVSVEESQGALDWRLTLLILLILGREVLLLVLLARGGPKAGPLSRHLADLALAGYAGLAMSCSWGMMTAPTEWSSGPWPLRVVEVVAAAGTFLVLYLPLRSPYLLENWQEPGWRRKRAVLSSVLVALIPALIAI